MFIGVVNDHKWEKLDIWIRLYKITKKDVVKISVFVLDSK